MEMESAIDEILKRGNINKMMLLSENKKVIQRGYYVNPGPV